jgi:hypothetical protein
LFCRPVGGKHAGDAAVFFSGETSGAGNENVQLIKQQLSEQVEFALVSEIVVLEYAEASSALSVLIDQW